MVDRSQHYSNTEADPAGALADRSKGEIRRAIVRPHRTEVMFGKPHARKALLLGVGNLIQGLVDALRLAGGGPGLGNLNLVEQADPHRIASLLSAKEEPRFSLDRQKPQHCKSHGPASRSVSHCGAGAVEPAGFSARPSACFYSNMRR